jgi:hypothetical protein
VSIYQVSSGQFYALRHLRGVHIPQAPERHLSAGSSTDGLTTSRYATGVIGWPARAPLGYTVTPRSFLRKTRSRFPNSSAPSSSSIGDGRCLLTLLPLIPSRA